MTNYDIYKLATQAARAAMEAFGDDGYGCGTSFVTIKGNTSFYREMKKLGRTSRSAYYGMILDTEAELTDKPKATLTEEVYNHEFAKVLRDNGIHAFAHTILT